MIADWPLLSYSTAWWRLVSWPPAGACRHRD